MENKQSICQQLNELVEQENILKAKMRPQDIDEVMKMIKDGHLKAKAGPAPLSEVVHAQPAHILPPSNSFPGLESQVVAGHNTTDPSIEMDQLDSTLVVADTSANTSNIINDN